MPASHATADQTDLLTFLFYAINNVALFSLMSFSFEKPCVRCDQQISLICHPTLILLNDASLQATADQTDLLACLVHTINNVVLFRCIAEADQTDLLQKKHSIVVASSFRFESRSD